MPHRMNINEAIMAACHAERDAMRSAPDTGGRLSTLQAGLNRAARMRDPDRQAAALRAVERGLEALEAEDRMFHEGLAPLREFRDGASVLAGLGIMEIDVPEDIVFDVLAYTDDVLRDVAEVALMEQALRDASREAWNSISGSLAGMSRTS